MSTTFYTYLLSSLRLGGRKDGGADGAGEINLCGKIKSKYPIIGGFKAMSEIQKFNDLYLKIAGLERRISKLEYGEQELNNVIDPQGWIGEAFERLIEDRSSQIADVNRRLDEVNGKIDIILKHITGISEQE